MVDVANIHLPVLLDDCVNLMAPALEHENAIAVDCTLAHDCWLLINQTINTENKISRFQDFIFCNTFPAGLKSRFPGR